MTWPRIVAEALRRVEPPARVATPGPAAASHAAIVAAITAASAPARSPQPPPAFLHPQQHDPWRRVMAALDGWHGALLLESVGTGKTWIALAAAARETGPVVAIVPAILRAQWIDAAGRARVPLQLWTHERASRGAAPDTNATLVIIDEAHRFRDVAARRTRTIAPWLVGRRTLLLTATPIVNRLADLVTLLRLAAPEDALALDGIARLGDLELMARPPAALRRIAIRSGGAVTTALIRRVALMPADPAEAQRAATDIAAISGLALSRQAPIRRLVTSVLLDAAASSDAALHQALGRYRALLLQARDAGGASRAMLRRFAGESLDQLVFWPLLATDVAADELPVADIDRVAHLLRAAPDDRQWMASLLERCADERPTILFTRHRATARQLRVTIGDESAWVTGTEAGIGAHRLPRDTVLAAFGPRRVEWRARRQVPRLLVATDVAAEGLDLHSAGRVVHVDVPWTAMRIEQREGRLLRLGQRHADVDVLIRVPAPAFEAALAPRARIRRKRRLADVWLGSLEVEDPATMARPVAPLAACVADGETDASVVAVRLEQGPRNGIVLMTRVAAGGWRIDGDTSTRLLQRSGHRFDSEYGVPGKAADIIDLGADSIANETAGAIGAAITLCSNAACGSPDLVRRIHPLARCAALRRDGSALQRLDRLLRFASTALTLGGRIIVARLADIDDDALLDAMIPDPPASEPLHGTAIATILFRSPDSSLR